MISRIDMILKEYWEKEKQKNEDRLAQYNAQNRLARYDGIDLYRNEIEALNRINAEINSILIRLIG